MDLYDSITIPNMFNAVVYVGLLVCIENWRRIRCSRHWIYMSTHSSTINQRNV